MGDKKESARSRCSSSRAKGVHLHRDTDIVANGWTRAQCRAMAVAMGGGWLVLAALEVFFQW